MTFVINAVLSLELADDLLLSKLVLVLLGGR